MGMAKYEISQQKKIELEERLHFLETTEKDRVLKFLHDNPIAESFHQAASIEAHRNAYEKELNELRLILKQCVIIDESKIDKSKIEIGCIVEVEIDNDLQRFQIVSSIEANPRENKISTESPIGSLLKGKKIGDSVVLNSGRKVVVKAIR